MFMFKEKNVYFCVFYILFLSIIWGNKSVWNESRWDSYWRTVYFQKRNYSTKVVLQMMIIAYST